MKPKMKTYQTIIGGRKVRVTVPARETATDILRDAIRDNFPPKTIAVLANAIRVQLNGKLADMDVRNELGWLAASLLAMVGERYHALLKQAGL
jgi:hypothetical protein